MRSANITSRVHDFMQTHVVAKREPDFIVGKESPDGIYLLRWHLTPWRNWIDMLPKERRLLRGFLRLWPNLYLHCFLRSDDDRALHDHPAAAVSWILHRGYVEHTIAAGGINHRRACGPGSIRYMPLRHTHRVELHRDDSGALLAAWSLFLFLPKVREWGFHHPTRGWIHWIDWYREFGS